MIDVIVIFMFIFFGGGVGALHVLLPLHLKLSEGDFELKTHEKTANIFMAYSQDGVISLVSHGCDTMKNSYYQGYENPLIP